VIDLTRQFEMKHEKIEIIKIYANWITSIKKYRKSPFLGEKTCSKVLVTIPE